jgi:hypothetical protein
MTIYIEQDNIERYIQEYTKKLEENELSDKEVDNRLEQHLKNNVVIKYSKKWKQERFDELMHIWTEVPGGYWILQEYIKMQHVEFQHPSQAHKKSYEKFNVSDNMAQKELTEAGYNYYKFFKEKGLIEKCQKKTKSL